MRKIKIMSFLVALLFSVTVFAQASHPYQIYQPNDIKWLKEFPGLKLPPGVEVAVLDGNPTHSEPFIMRLKFPANFKLAPHTHPSPEHATVISGDLNFGYGQTFDEKHLIKVHVGGLIVIPVNTPHYGMTGKEGAIVQLNSTGPWLINFVKPKS